MYERTHAYKSLWYWSLRWALRLLCDMMFLDIWFTDKVDKVSVPKFTVSMHPGLDILERKYLKLFQTSDFEKSH